MKQLLAGFALVTVLVPSLALASVDLTLIGGAVKVPDGSVFSEPGYFANSTIDGDITGLVSVQVPTMSKPGTYSVLYSVTDSNLDSAFATRFVTISGSAGQLWCSSPTAPGWNTSIPNGGCGGTSSFVPYNTSYTMGGVTDTCRFFQGCMIR